MTIERIKRHGGIAGQFMVTATISEGTAVRDLAFVGSVYGGPVVMIGESGAQTFVTDPGRFGAFDTEWVRRFLETAR